MGKAIDMTGQITDEGVYIIERDYSNTHEAHWRCICPNCKREDWIVKGSRLRGSNQVKMCKQCTAMNNLKKIKEPYYKDIKGQRFGMLTAIERTNEKNKTTYLWKCKCDCGKICIKDGEYLRNGDTQSCGCNSSSRGEAKIKSLLQENNIPYKTEVSFDNFTYEETKGKPRFDFQIMTEDGYYLIEYDGKQHFEKTLYSEDLTKIKNNDKIKNNWCIKNKIPLIRIPYSHYNKLSIKDLLLETSDFIIKEEENEQ